MNELEQFKDAMEAFNCCEAGEKTYGLCAFMVTPTGSTMSYARMVDKAILESGSPKVLQFYGDDMMAAFQRLVLDALPDREAKSSEDSSLEQEPDVNAGLTEGIDSDADTSENLWESEGGQNTT